MVRRDTLEGTPTTADNQALNIGKPIAKSAVMCGATGKSRQLVEQVHCSVYIASPPLVETFRTIVELGLPPHGRNQADKAVETYSACLQIMTQIALEFKRSRR